MKFQHHILLLVWWFIAFWFAPAFLANIEFGIQTRNAEQVLEGHRVLWFKHHDVTCGCLAKWTPWRKSTSKYTYEDFPPSAPFAFGIPNDPQRLDCDCEAKYNTDPRVQRWVQDIKELR